MSKLIDELKPYKRVYSDFCAYVQKELKLNPEDFVTKASNAQLIPQVINYLEDRGDHDFLDAVCYTNFNTGNLLSYNELVKKTIKVVFFMIEKEQKLEFIPY